MSINPPHHQAIDFAGRVVWSNLSAIDNQSAVFVMRICFEKIFDIDRYSLVDFVTSQLENRKV